MRDRRFFRNPDVFRVELGGDIGIVAYAPQIGCAAQCADGHLPHRLAKEVDAWRKEHRNDTGHTPTWPPCSLTVLPTWSCNFHCSYCFSADGRRRGGGNVDTSQILGALKWLTAEYKCKWISLNFAGGGEPLLSWPVVHDSIEGARRIARDSEFELRLGLVTNASLVTEKQANFLFLNRVNVTASWDVLPDIQGRQRGEPQKVIKGIQTLIDSGVCVSVRTTITPGIENRQTDMVKALVRLKPGISSAVFEPALPFDCDLITFRRHVEGFLTGFKAARQIAHAENLTLATGLLGRLVCFDSRFCAVGWTLTPDGQLSLCHRIAHPLDNGFDHFAFGRVNNNGEVVVDEALRCRLVAEDSVFNPRCRNCFARWNCGGGCRVRNQFLPASHRRFLCRTTRGELRSLIAETISKTRTPGK